MAVDLFVLEVIAVAGLLLIAGASGQRFARPLRRLEAAFDRLARRRGLALTLVVLACLAGRIALLPLIAIPQPGIDDEFSNLLAGDTFASGRLTNPTHPMWQHFESFQVIHQPSYQSSYPPAQGIVLAFGQVLFGQPWFGVWLSVGLMCGAIAWTLYGWLPPRWALFGGVVATVRLGLFSYWMNGYWGGAVPAIGGCLVVGALPRLWQHRRTRDALLLGAGIALLANSRPWEGLVLTAAALIAGLLWFPKGGLLSRVTLARVAVPLLLSLLLTAAATMYYFWRVTGNPLRMPYEVNRATYAVSQPFYWQEVPTVPTLRHRVMADYYLGRDLDWYAEAFTLAGFARHQLNKLRVNFLFYLGPLLLVPVAMFPSMLRDRRLRPVWLIVAVFVVGLGLEIWPAVPHYSAPATGLLYILLMQGMRHWRAKDRHTAGILVTWGFLAICVGLLAVRTAGAEPHLAPHFNLRGDAWWCSIPGGDTRRSELLARLQAMPGEHLVIVRYGPVHTSSEWVYNGANIDSQKVVWARDMGEAGNRELVRYYGGRHLWIVDADAANPQLLSYAPPADHNQAAGSLAK